MNTMRPFYSFKLMLLCCLMVAGNVMAAVVSPEEAQQIAAEFLGNKTTFVGYRLPGKHNLQLKATRHKTQSEEPAFYVFETNNDGFILVSADDRVRPILGHAKSGNYDEEQMPENMIAWLDYLTERISNVKDSQVPVFHLQSRYTEVSPLLEIDGIQWGQGKPYNNNCPKIGSTQCPSGCVATATAQIMRYWKHPEQGSGSHSYEWNSKTLSSNFSEHSYSWINMPGKYISDQYTTAQANAVALLLSDVGIGCEMNYGKDGSSSNEYMAAQALACYFGYDSAMIVIRKDYIGLKAFEQAVSKELLAGRPVLMGGSSETGSGHAFVCDGVNSDGFYHINWGWDGWYNGDFALDAMYPEGQGTGGAAEGEGYTEGVSAVIGIRPNQGNGPITKIEVESLQQTTEKEAIQRDEKFQIMWTNLANGGIFKWEGYIGLVVCDEEHHIVDNFFILTSQTLALDFGHYFPSLGLPASNVDNTLPDGNYQIVAVYTETPSSDSWSPILFRNGEWATLDFTISNDSIHFVEKEEIVDPDSYLANLTAEVQGESVLFQWEAPLPTTKYVLSVYYGSEEEYLFARDTITATEDLVKFYYPGTITYSWSVRALNESDKVLEKRVGMDVSVTVTTDYTPGNLQHEVKDNGILFTWEGKAPIYMFELKYQGELAIRQFPTDTLYFLDSKPNGEYEWSVRSLDPTLSFYISEAVSDKFTLQEEVEKVYLEQLAAENLGNECMKFTWKAPTPSAKYVVNVYIESEDTYLFSSDTVTTTQAVVRSYYPGTLEYSWNLKALDANNVVLDSLAGEDFSMTVTTDYTPKNLHHEVKDNGILFTWEGKAPVYMLELKLNGELVWRDFPTETQYLLPYKPDGEYEWSIRSLNEYMSFFISNAVSESFSLPESQGIEDINSEKEDSKFLKNGQLFIRKNGKTYDILGR